jgi:phage baseplate assembly protein V
MSDTTHRRVMNLITRGRLVAVDDTHGLQLVQVRLLRSEGKDNVERFQQYGFSSVPTPDCEAVVLFPGGSRDHGIVLSIDNRGARMRGQAAGEVSIYSDEGDYIALKRGNEIEVVTKTLTITVDTEIIINAPKITIIAPEIDIQGNINLTGNLTATGAINAPHGSVGS